MAKSSNSKFKKNVIWNMIGTTINAFNSLFFLILVTRINGVNNAGVFAFAFSTACLFYVIGIYSGRAYQITETDKKLTDSDYFYTKIVTCILMIVVTLLFCFVRGYNLYKFVIILELVFYKVLEAFSESSYAVIQRKDELYRVGISMFVKAFLSIVLFIIVDIFTHNLILASFMIIVANLLVILFYDFYCLKKFDFSINKINYNNIIALLKKGFYAFGFSFLTIYVINAAKYSIDILLTDKDQTIYGVLIMPATAIALFGQYVIQPYIVPLKEKLKKDFSSFVNTTIKLSIIIFLFGIVASVICYFIGIPILNLLYGISLKSYRIPLIIIVLGAAFYSASISYTNSLITMRNTKSQFYIYLIASIITLVLSYYLTKYFKVAGSCLSYALTMVLILVLYIILFISEVKKWRKSYEK